MENESQLSKFAQKLELFKYFSYHRFLDDLYTLHKNELKKYSYFQFSEDLGFGRNDSSRLIIRGSRKLTEKNAKRIIRKLGLKGENRKFFWNLFLYSSEKDKEKKEFLFNKLVNMQMRNLLDSSQINALKFFEAWHTAVVFELCGFENYSKDAKSISEKIIFPVSVIDVQKSLDLLVELKLVKFSKEKKRYRKLTEHFDPGVEVLGMGINTFNHKMIDLAKWSLDFQAPQNREISSVTLSVTKELKQEIKKKIHSFQDELFDLVENVEGSEEVIQINFQLFPLVKD